MGNANEPSVNAKHTYQQHFYLLLILRLARVRYFFFSLYHGAVIAEKLFLRRGKCFIILKFMVSQMLLGIK